MALGKINLMLTSCSRTVR